MKKSKRYKQWIILGLPISVILATLIGTPHTLFDPLLYMKISLNLFSGGIIWLFLYLLSAWFDRVFPWESANHLKRWIIQLSISLPGVIGFVWVMVLVRNEFIGWPTSTHLFLYTDVPILSLIAIGIQILYQKISLSSLSDSGDRRPASFLPVITIKNANKTYVIPIDDIAYLYRKGDFNYLRKWNGQDLLADQSLKMSETLLDSTLFFRINRKLLVHRRSISDYKILTDRKTEINLNPPLEGVCQLNKNRLKQFKRWLNIS